MEHLEEIIKNCQQQDSRSQEVLYRKYYPAFYALCKCFFSDPHDVLTAVNNGMLRVFKNINQYNPDKGDFFNWCYTIIRNAALTLIRDKKSKLTYELTEHLQEAGTDNPFRKLEWKDIYYYLGQLPQNTRCVCSLYYLEGFSIKEIAAAIDMKEGTVKWHLKECRSKLKSILEQPKTKISG
ncbi:MAG: sigma-70 family RNA polymerase sigma factor [Bacteroidetes bacterium]|nr:sigma-70 family RNA polymerase sigma factor [Bacteroidota bacterium]